MRTIIGGISPDFDLPRFSHPSVLLAEPRGGVPGLVDTCEKFEAAVDDLAAHSGPIAADAERASSYRYSHSDYLIQLKRADSAIYLLDIPALRAQNVDFSQLTKRMPEAEWILHDARQDLPGFVELGIRPSKLFDTEFAARFLGLNHVGLAACTQKFLNLDLAKEHAAVDWSIRPLPRDWRNYAALDVELLSALRAAMHAALEQTNKLAWAQIEFADILRKGTVDPEVPAEPWRHVSNITSLGSDRRALAIVRSMWTVRDAIARDLDIEPTLLLKDATIIKSASMKPHNRRQFMLIPELFERVRAYTNGEQEKMFERYAPLQRKVKPRVWTKAILDGLRVPYAKLPAGAAPKAHDGTSVPRSMKYWRTHQPDRYRRLMSEKQRLSDISEATRIPVDLLIKPKLLRDFFWQEEPVVDAAEFFRERGARPWQCRLVCASLSGSIM